METTWQCPAKSNYLQFNVVLSFNEKHLTSLTIIILSWELENTGSF